MWLGFLYSVCGNNCNNWKRKLLWMFMVVVGDERWMVCNCEFIVSLKIYLLCGNVVDLDYKLYWFDYFCVCLKM